MLALNSVSSTGLLRYRSDRGQGLGFRGGPTKIFLSWTTVRLGRKPQIRICLIILMVAYRRPLWKRILLQLVDYQELLTGSS